MMALEERLRGQSGDYNIPQGKYEFQYINLMLVLQVKSGDHQSHSDTLSKNQKCGLYKIYTK